MCPTGIATQNTERIEKFMGIDEGGKKIGRFINTVTHDIATITRICGKSNIHDLDTTDLFALTELASKVSEVELG